MWCSERLEFLLRFILGPKSEWLAIVSAVLSRNWLRWHLSNMVTTLTKWLVSVSLASVILTTPLFQKPYSLTSGVWCIPQTLFPVFPLWSFLNTLQLKFSKMKKAITSSANMALVATSTGRTLWEITIRTWASALIDARTCAPQQFRTIPVWCNLTQSTLSRAPQFT